MASRGMKNIDNGFPCHEEYRQSSRHLLFWWHPCSNDGVSVSFIGGYGERLAEDIDPVPGR